MQHTETLRENLTPDQVLAIRNQAISQGKRVNVMRLHSRLVQIEIITPDRAIEVTPKAHRGGHHLLT